tara:strand:+ start:1553 stop:1657 length:105 start_codon:yes stop_codon:yes gene_type:complete
MFWQAFFSFNKQLDLLAYLEVLSAPLPFSGEKYA